MGFYRPDGAMAQILANGLGALAAEGRPQLQDEVSITWVRYPQHWRTSLAAARDQASGGPGSGGGSGGGAGGASPPGLGASWAGDRPRYPASVVKLLYLVAAEAWLQRQLIEDSPELRRALATMVRDSSNDATSLVVDLLTGTTSGPDLEPAAFDAWSRQRQLMNDWYRGLGWGEWAGCNACQKTWGDGPFGRERQSYGAALENRNQLTTDLTARLLQEVMAGAVVSPPACGRMVNLLQRSLDPRDRSADPENQVDGFLGAGLPDGARLWSKAGWMSAARHDAAYVEWEGHDPMLLVVFSEGRERARDERLLPELARLLLRHGTPPEA